MERAFAYYDANADLHRGYTIKANTIARVRYFAAWQGNPDDEPVPLDEALESPDIDTQGLTQQIVDLANETLWRVQSPEGGQGELSRLMALNVDIAGMGWLLGREHPVDGSDVWGVYSVDQIRYQSDGWWLYNELGTAAKGVPIGPDDVLIKVWRKHPRLAEAADSAFRALLDLLEQMHLLQAETTAAASSRLAGSGLLLVDSRIDIPQQPDQDANYNTAQAAMESLLEASSTAIRDPSSAEAAVPLMFQGEAPDGGKISDLFAHLTFDRPLHEATVRRYMDLRREIIDGADFPPEWVYGLGQTSTYANARIVTSEGYYQDVDPTALIVAYGYQEWERTALVTAGVPSEVVRKIVVWRDPDSVISKPDRAKYAAELAKAAPQTGPIISAEAVRAALGFDEGDAPTEEELADWRENQAIRGLPGAGDEGNAASEDNPNADDDSAVTTAAIPPPIALGTGKPSPALLARTSSRLVSIDVQLTARLVTAADTAVTNGINRAGAMLRAKAQGSKALKAKLGRCKNAEVFSVLGSETVAALATEDELLGNALGPLHGQYDTWTLAAQRQALATARKVAPDAYTDAEVAALERRQDEDRAEGWAWLSAALLALMAGRLNDPASGFPDQRGEWDPSTSVPYGYLRSAVAIAGGDAVTRASGTGAVLTAAGEPAGGIGNGSLILDSLRINAGVTTASYIWLHGGAANVFEPHADLDGVEFTSWEDPVLANAEAWPPFPYYFSSDHDGCSCSAERVLVVE